MLRKQALTPLLVLFAITGLNAQEENIVNMLSLHEGGLPVAMPPAFSGWPVFHLLDGSVETGWACERGRVSDNVFVFSIVAETDIRSFGFDTSHIDTQGAAAKEVTVEISTSGPESGFKQVLATTLEENTDGQTFALSQPVTARWIRLTVKNNYGHAEWTELFGFQAWGQKPHVQPMADISGTYSTSFSDFHVRQNGTSLSGCYEYDGGILDGSIDGRVMKITWKEDGGPNDRGPAVMIFSDDSPTFQGYWWYMGREGGAPAGRWNGEKKTDEVGGCPHWQGSAGGELERSLAEEKRARVYGILFDFNSAAIRGESRPVMEEVAQVLEKNPEWQLTIEGHTDSVGSGDFNLQLSRERATSVREYLVDLGIDASRLETEGYGETQPVADNATELGRSQNRRVELVRK